MELAVKRFDELTVPELYEILRVRTAVFVVEQKCPYMETDGLDQSAYHVFLHEDGRILAYLRAYPSGGEARIGRVLSITRGAGHGAAVLDAGIRTVRERMRAERIVIEAQTYARGFYERAGFIQTSDEFMEDGIPHIEMVLKLGAEK